MADKNGNIVNAATRMFARYGFTKTTMGDIATEAGVARQTVYNAFPGKEEIMRAVVRQAMENTFTQVDAAWAETTSLDAKLTAFHELAPLAWFEAIRAAPDWAELMDGMHAAASEELKAMDTKWKVILGDMLQSHTTMTGAPTLTDADVVEFFYSASINAKSGATDVAHLRARLATIKAATLALLREHATR